jgi:hypothetical protein
VLERSWLGGLTLIFLAVKHHEFEEANERLDPRLSM